MHVSGLKPPTYKYHCRLVPSGPTLPASAQAHVWREGAHLRWLDAEKLRHGTWVNQMLLREHPRCQRLSRVTR
jgi:hypothetical protein